jgi:hypothetical protein
VVTRRPKWNGSEEWELANMVVKDEEGWRLARSAAKDADEREQRRLTKQRRRNTYMRQKTRPIPCERIGIRVKRTHPYVGGGHLAYTDNEKCYKILIQTQYNTIHIISASAFRSFDD